MSGVPDMVAGITPAEVEVVDMMRMGKVGEVVRWSRRKWGSSKGIIDGTEGVEG